MDAHLWHRQATTSAASLPEPLAIEQREALPPDERDQYVDDLTAAFDALVLPSDKSDRARNVMTRIVQVNERRPPGAQRIIAVNAPFTVGKSTFVKAWGQSLHREWLGGALGYDRPSWNPEPHRTADLVPVIYVTLRAASLIKEVNAQILTFLRYPTEGLTRVTTTKVVQALFNHGVRLLIIDDVHMLRTNLTHERDTLDYLKFLNSELGELGGTLVLVGAFLQNGPIHGDPQIHGRLQSINVGPYEIDSEGGKRDWQRFLKDAEQVLLPFLSRAEPGVFARENASFIWRRTQGFVGDTATLLSEAVLDALDEKSPTVTRDHLANVTLSQRAVQAEADLTAVNGNTRVSRAH